MSLYETMIGLFCRASRTFAKERIRQKCFLCALVVSKRPVLGEQKMGMLGKCLEVVKHAWKCIRVPLFDLRFPKVSIHFDSASAQKHPPEPVPTAEGPRIAVIIFEIFGHTWERHKDGKPPWYDVTGVHFNPRKTAT